MTPDPCCYWCRTPFGCANNRCEHHVKHEAQDEADAKARRTVRDPTADRAIGNVMREQQRRGKSR